VRLAFSVGMNVGMLMPGMIFCVHVCVCVCHGDGEKVAHGSFYIFV